MMTDAHPNNNPNDDDERHNPFADGTFPIVDNDDIYHDGEASSDDAIVPDDYPGNYDDDDDDDNNNNAAANDELVPDDRFSPYLADDIPSRVSSKYDLSSRSGRVGGDERFNPMADIAFGEDNMYPLEVVDFDDVVDDDNNNRGTKSTVGILSRCTAPCASIIRRDRKKSAMAAIALFTVAAVAIGLVIRLQSGGSSMRGSSLSSSVSGAASARYERIKNAILERHGLDNDYASAWEVKDSPQSRALQWIVEEDPAWLTLGDDDDDDVSDDDDDRDVVVDALIRRYALAVIYFGNSVIERYDIQDVVVDVDPKTGRGKNNNNWSNSTNWISSRGVCSWHGVECAPDEEGRKSYDGDGNVTALRLSNNALRHEIPEEIGFLTDLRELILKNNALSGTIPSKVFEKLARLEKFDVGTNILSGTIPSSIGNIKNLEHFYVNSNLLTGQIPDTICNLANLVWLGLFENALTGTIPVDFGKLVNLYVVYLDNNKLQGQIPNSFGDLVRVSDVRLFKNELTGTIPSSVGFMKSLEILYLDHNKIGGSIPDEIAMLPSIRQIHLYKNKLVSSLPDSIGSLETLESFHVDNNKLTGHIPKSIGSLKNLEALFLFLNEITGKIPTQIGTMRTLRKLRVQNNTLSGTIPTELGSLTELEDLYLEYNYFHGHIPVQFGNLTNLKKMNVQGNKFLKGSVPDTVCDLRRKKLSSLVYACGGQLECDCCTQCD